MFLHALFFFEILAISLKNNVNEPSYNKNLERKDMPNFIVKTKENDEDIKENNLIEIKENSKRDDAVEEFWNLNKDNEPRILIDIKKNSVGSKEKSKYGAKENLSVLEIDIYIKKPINGRKNAAFKRIKTPKSHVEGDPFSIKAQNINVQDGFLNVYQPSAPILNAEINTAIPSSSHVYNEIKDGFLTDNDHFTPIFSNPDTKKVANESQSLKKEIKDGFLSQNEMFSPITSGPDTNYRNSIKQNIKQETKTVLKPRETLIIESDQGLYHDSNLKEPLAPKLSPPVNSITKMSAHGSKDAVIHPISLKIKNQNNSHDVFLPNYEPLSPVISEP